MSTPGVPHLSADEQPQQESSHAVSGRQLDSAMPSQRREWRWRRVTTVVLVLLLGAALVGAFGEGPLSKQTLTRGDLNVVHEQSGHGEHAQQLRIVGGDSQPGAEAVLSLVDQSHAAQKTPDQPASVPIPAAPDVSAPAAWQQADDTAHRHRRPR